MSARKRNNFGPVPNYIHIVSISGLKFRATVKWICLLVGFFGGIASTVLHFKTANGKQNEVIKIPPTTEVIGNDIESGAASATKSHQSDSNSVMGDMHAPNQRPESRY